jgi:hypothetical protein
MMDDAVQEIRIGDGARGVEGVKEALLERSGPCFR